MDQTAEKVKMRNADTFGGNFPVRVYKVSTGWCQETHSHEYMQIWYVVSGACTHIVEGAEYPLHAKNVFVIPPFVEHGLKDERDNLTIICCEFPAELITGDNLFDPAGRGLLRYTCIESFAAVLGRTRPCHTPGELCRMKLERLLEEMLAEYDRRAEFYEIVLKADVLKLLTLLARDYGESMTDGGAIVRSYSAYIDKAVAFIEEGYRGKLHIEDAAKAASMSVSYFSYFFRERTGLSFRESCLPPPDGSGEGDSPARRYGRRGRVGRGIPGYGVFQPCVQTDAGRHAGRVPAYARRKTINFVNHC